jgi:hypothetical protein
VDAVCYRVSETLASSDNEADEGEAQVYAVTENGILVLFNADAVLEKWVDLKV